MTTAFKMTIEYDGSAYSGWQIQNDVPTVLGEIEKALLRLTQKKCRVIASGRTDAGVHALGQVASFKAETSLSADRMEQGLNSLLPPDIVIRNLDVAPSGFHPRYDATSKVYRYQILNRSRPAAIGRQYAWHVRRYLNVEFMQRAAAHLVGRHDFTSFEGAGSPRGSSVRHVFTAQWTEEATGLLVFNIEADGFLRFMVRNIVGTLVEVGLFKRSPEDIKQILEAQNRSLAGPTAPPWGLFLVRVNYSRGAPHAVQPGPGRIP